MSALGRKVLDLAEQQGLLDGRAIAELRKQVAESKFVVTPEAIAKVLVDHGHLTPFQARKLVSQALGNEPDPVEQRASERARSQKKKQPVEELTLADSSDEDPLDESDEEEIVELEAIDLELKPDPPRPSARKPGSSSPSVGAPPSIAPKKQAKDQPPAALDRPVEGSTAEDFVEL
jgi:hypothetical protein